MHSILWSGIHARRRPERALVCCRTEGISAPEMRFRAVSGWPDHAGDPKRSGELGEAYWRSETSSSNTTVPTIPIVHSPLQ